MEDVQADTDSLLYSQIIEFSVPFVFFLLLSLSCTTPKTKQTYHTFSYTRDTFSNTYSMYQTMFQSANVKGFVRSVSQQSNVIKMLKQTLVYMKILVFDFHIYSLPVNGSPFLCITCDSLHLCFQGTFVFTYEGR